MTMTRYTFNMRYKTHTVGGVIVTIPDQVAREQRDYNGKSFPVLRHDGARTRATLRGDLYGLGTSGTGDPIVTLD